MGLFESGPQGLDFLSVPLLHLVDLSAVREPVYLHDTENRLKCPPVPRLHPGAGSPPDLHDVNPSFPLGA